MRLIRQFARSKFGVVLLTTLLGVAFFTATSYAQTAPGGETPEAPQSSAIMVTLRLVAQHIIDPITITIALLSIFGLTLIFYGFIRNRESVFMPEATTQQMRELIQQKKFKELIEFTENDPSFVAKALNPALKRAPSFSSMKEAMETALGEQTAETFRSIEFLNIIGNLGPLLGLLGTVMGMVQAFDQMNQSKGNASPGQLAGGISTALTHTFLGLFLAVPCLAAFGVLRTIIDRLTVRGALVCEELLLMVKPQESKPAPAAPGGRAPGAPPVPGMPGVRRAPAVPAPAPAPM
jgi:biopolymer transport protein ExbB